MTNTTPDPDASSPISMPLRAGLAAACLFAAAVACVGMAASFHTVCHTVAPSFTPGWAWTVPVTLDLSIAAFSLLEVVLLRLDLPHALPRLAVYAATAASVYLNTHGAGGTPALLAHAAMPATWTVFIESVRTAATAHTRRTHHATNRPAHGLFPAPARMKATWRRSLPPPTEGGQPPIDACAALPEGDTRSHETPTGAADYDSDHDAHTNARAAVRALRVSNPQLTQQQIADQLGVSPRTVRRHLSRP